MATMGELEESTTPKAAMARLERNLIANFCGIGVAAGAPLLFNIVYYRILGSEAFALVGLYLTVQMLAVSLDLGLTRTTTREVARAMSQANEQGSIRSTVLTLLILSSLLFIFFALSVIAASGWISHVWLEKSQIGEFDVSTGISLIGVAVALQQPRSIFLGALNGLQGQVLTNALIAFSAISRGALTLSFLSLAPNLSVFFGVQLLMTAIETLLIGVIVWHRLPHAGRSTRFDPSVVRDVARFALGDGLNVVIGTLVIQGDKLLLSGMVSLQVFGSYSLLSLLAQSLARMAAPFTVAYFPPLVEFWQRRDSEGLVKCFRRASLGFTALLVPATISAIAFADPITQIILKGSSGITHPETVLVLLSLAFASNAMMHLPYTIQLAAGWTRPGLMMNMIVFCIYIPLLVLFVPAYGVIAAAWLLLAAMWIPFPFFIEVTRRRLLGECSWWTGVLVVPTLISGACLLPAYFISKVLAPWPAILIGAAAGLVSFLLIKYLGEALERAFMTLRM